MNPVVRSFLFITFLVRGHIPPCKLDLQFPSKWSTSNKLMRYSLSPSGGWWIWSPPATAHSLEAYAARAVVPLLLPEPSVQQGARAPALTGLAPRAQPLFRNMRQEPFVVPCSSIPVSSPRPGTSCRVTHTGPAIIPSTTRQDLWASHGPCHGLAASVCARPGPQTNRLRRGACPGPGAPSTLPVLPALRWCFRLPPRGPCCSRWRTLPVSSPARQSRCIAVSSSERVSERPLPDRLGSAPRGGVP